MSCCIVMLSCCVGHGGLSITRPGSCFTHAFYGTDLSWEVNDKSWNALTSVQDPGIRPLPVQEVKGRNGTRDFNYFMLCYTALFNVIAYYINEEPYNY